MLFLILNHRGAGGIRPRLADIQSAFMPSSMSSPMQDTMTLP